MNQRYQSSTNLMSPRHFSSKYSLKMRRKITQTTQKSTDCHSIDGGGGKTSIRNLLHQTKLRSHASQSYLNLKYEDIKVKVIHKPKPLFSSFLCTIVERDQEQGCKCEPKCIWVDRWLSLSSGYPKYKYTRPEGVEKAIQTQIKKDLKRTQPDIRVFQQQNYQNALYTTLHNYAKIDKEVGYVQGMNLIASVFVYHAKNMYQCDELMRFFMVVCDFREIYLKDFSLAYKCANLLQKSLNHRCHDLYSHLTQKSINLSMFIVGWMLGMLANVIPLQFMHLVMNNFIEKKWYGLLNILLTIFIYMKKELLEIQDEVQLMEKLSVGSMKKMKVNWEQIIISANNVYVLKEGLK